MWVLTALALVVILISGVILWRSVGGSCGGDRTDITVVADPTIAPTLTSLAEKASQDSCFDYRVDALAGGAVPELLTGTDNVPDLWVADSQYRARRVAAQVRLGSGAVTQSLATSPAVVVSTRSITFDTWVDVMKLVNLRIGNPASSTLADAPIIGALDAAASGKVNGRSLLTAMAEMAAQRNNVAPLEDTEQARLTLANSSTVPVVTSEQQYLQFLRGNAGSRLLATTPAAGTVLVDYPLVVAGGENRDRAEKAGQTLTNTARSDAGQEILNSAGFRDPDGSGVGDAVKTLSVEPGKLDAALDQWHDLSLPTRTIMAIDTSGSMAAAAGDSTRAGLLTEAVTNAFTLIPRNGVVGVWIFGIDKGGRGTDWKEVVPSRRLDAKVGNQVQREMLVAGVREAMTTELGGGTGLYDTILAGYKTMLDTYDPNYSNTFTVLTDGRNEDSQSMSLSELLKQLKALADPGRPVRVMAMGISRDADVASLTAITDVTGGATFVATDPSKIRTLFEDAARTRLASAGSTR
ncbi:VWA domain-containing protein [Gordonia pseudamarae]|uniref:VWA domain-containing protein n=2 Tax=Gordoniaceae TaxID=85026 RepID=A0ABX6IQS9_9ACTN|nr:substrate-binding domain-containing protein [Gordonia sp. (in: high G+C Gram-positive bacteria)]QHN28496.1 VWA domain-containing protein [Gordonia pseudamarae]QHN37363.1 VWA domain-containing protein [Gordonia pseudamarae]